MKLKIVLDDSSKNIDDVIKYAHDGDAGADIFLQEDTVIKHGKNVIPCGFKLILPLGVMALLFPRSSVMGDDMRFDQAPFDPMYSGEWNMVIHNSGSDKLIPKGTRLCQAVFLPFIQADLVKEYSNVRSNGGLGSTGK